MQIAKEKLTESLIQELYPLLKNHWAEVAHYKDIELDPDWDAYASLQEQGKYLSVIARDEFGQVAGYMGIATGPNAHYKNTMMGMVDVIYLSLPNRRGTTAAKLIRYAEELAEVDILHFHVKIQNDFSPLLERMGYEKVEYLLSKRLDSGSN